MRAPPASRPARPDAETPSRFRSAASREQPHSEQRQAIQDLRLLGQRIVLALDSFPGPAELLARFRADARWARIPVVVTGSATELLGDLQVDGVLPKPFDAERLVNLGRESIAR